MHLAPAPPTLGLATLRVALARRGLPVRPQGAPSEPRGVTPPDGGEDRHTGDQALVVMTQFEFSISTICLQIAYRY